MERNFPWRGEVDEGGDADEDEEGDVEVEEDEEFVKGRNKLSRFDGSLGVDKEGEEGEEDEEDDEEEEDEEDGEKYVKEDGEDSEEEEEEEYEDGTKWNFGLLGEEVTLEEEYVNWAVEVEDGAGFWIMRLELDFLLSFRADSFDWNCTEKE